MLKRHEAHKLEPSDVQDIFHLAIEACPAAMIMTSSDGLIMLINAECEEMFGYKRGDLIGAPVEVLIPARLKDEHLAHRGGFAGNPTKRQMGVGRDLRAVRFDGSEFPVEIGLTPFPTSNGLCIMAFVIDISARRAAENSIRDYNEQLERANEGLARFAHVASHDIQEPLRKIVTFAGIQKVALANNDMDEVIYAAEIMQGSARHARSLVSGLLDLSKSMNGEYHIERTSIRIAIYLAVNALSQVVEEKQADLKFDIEDFCVEADQRQFTCLVQNIVANALKYHKPGQSPAIQITAKVAGASGPILSIADTGIGFATNFLVDIFEPFKRLHTRDEYPGSGIGLAICSAIAKRHKWTLTAKAEPGVGATFEIGFGRVTAAEPGRRRASTEAESAAEKLPCVS